MYQITCDGLPLMDWRDNDLVLVNPKLKLEVNTVGEGSFTIYKNHPHYSKLKKLKSVFEVRDDYGVIFRGRATGDTVDFNQGMFVDLEGAMAFFNDSIVRSFSFPFDFKDDADYINAAANGNVIAFFLGWLIDNHNSQVQDFQKMKLGNVTVTDPNNYLSRSTSEYASTWEVLKAKLFDSSLGGYLCIRYEDDGNYIDYLSEFTDTNSQEIAFGENLLDLKRETEASETYSAIIPVGALGLTVEGVADRDVTDDIVKRGDTLYSRKAVEEYGWIYAPVAETTWDDVTEEANLLSKGAEWLANGGALLQAMEATAVDLHFTNEQTESLRIYKNVNVCSKPHGVSESFPLAKLELDLLNPQNTKITVGKMLLPLTERTAMLQEEAKKRYSRLSKTDEEIRLEVRDEIKNLSTEISETLDDITLSVSNGTDSSTITLTIGETSVTSPDIKFNGVVTFSGLADGSTEINGGCIKSGKIKADYLEVSKINVGDLNDDVGLVNSQNVTTITQNAISTAEISASQITAGTLNAAKLKIDGMMPLTNSTYTYGKIGYGTGKTVTNGVEEDTVGVLLQDLTDNNYFIATTTGVRMTSFSYAYKTPYSLSCYGSASATGGIAATHPISITSDRQAKNDVDYDMERYEGMFKDLKPCSFTYKNEGEAAASRIGFVAQDVLQAAEDNGLSRSDIGLLTEQDGKYSLGYTEFVGLNTYMIQKILKKLETIDERLSALEQQKT